MKLVLMLIFFYINMYAQDYGNYYDGYTESERPVDLPSDYYQQYFSEETNMANQEISQVDEPVEEAVVEASEYPSYAGYYNYYDTPSMPTQTITNLESAVAETKTNTSENILEEMIMRTYLPAYKTYNTKKMKSYKIPSLISSGSLLQNLDKTDWYLKYSSENPSSFFNSLTLDFDDNTLVITSLGVNNEVLNVSTMYLTPIKMYKPNEGIFAYTINEQVSFLYIQLLLPHLLAVEMASTFEEAEKSLEKPLQELGVFILI